eukprot:scaffold251364_cov18-Tisochrysis_lutea.AAC.1
MVIGAQILKRPCPDGWMDLYSPSRVQALLSPTSIQVRPALSLLLFAALLHCKLKPMKPHTLALENRECTTCNIVPPQRLWQ